MDRGISKRSASARLTQLAASPCPLDSLCCSPLTPPCVGDRDAFGRAGSRRPPAGRRSARRGRRNGRRRSSATTSAPQDRSRSAIGSTLGTREVRKSRRRRRAATPRATSGSPRRPASPGRSSGCAAADRPASAAELHLANVPRPDVAKQKSHSSSGRRPGVSDSGFRARHQEPGVAGSSPEPRTPEPEPARQAVPSRDARLECARTTALLGQGELLVAEQPQADHQHDQASWR